MKVWVQLFVRWLDRSLFRLSQELPHSCDVQTTISERSGAQKHARGTKSNTSVAYQNPVTQQASNFRGRFPTHQCAMTLEADDDKQIS